MKYTVQLRTSLSYYVQRNHFKLHFFSQEYKPYGRMLGDLWGCYKHENCVINLDFYDFRVFSFICTKWELIFLYFSLYCCKTFHQEAHWHGINRYKKSSWNAWTKTAYDMKFPRTKRPILNQPRADHPKYNNFPKIT